MKRFHAAALVAALAVPAWAQQPPAKSDSITLTGQDGKPHACKILRTYKHSSGGTALEVKDETNGEILTVIEDASPEAVKAEVKTEQVKVTESAKPADPILQPKEYAATKAQEQFGPAPAAVPALPASQYVRPTAPVATPAPAPAPRRWFGWLRNDPPAPKPAPIQTKAKPKPQPPADEVVALYHPDPVIRLIGSMTDDLLPSLREVSAETLARTAKDRPEVVDAMIRSVQTDLAPSVRICCCRCLVEMQVRSPECVSALKSLEDDREQSVRTAAAAALSVLEPQ